MMERIFTSLLIFVPLTIGARFLHVSPIAVFFLASIAVVPLAKMIGDSTEELASRTTPAIGGILNATFGNATELIIGFFALRAGLIGVVKASITGSIVGNLLLVLGFAMLVGGWGRERQTFNKTGALASASTLLLATVALVMPALFSLAVPERALAIEPLSVWVATLLLILYFAYLYFLLHTHKHLYTEELAHAPTWSVSRSVITLLVATLAIAWVSEILVGAIEPLVVGLGWSQMFIGVVFVAIIGNAAEHFSAVTVARKQRMDLSLQISIGSATQIALLVAPLLVLLSLVIGTPMNLIFDAFELVAIIFSVLIVNFAVADGESNWLEGAQLLAAYTILAVVFFLHP